MIAEQRMGHHGMKRSYFPGIIDIVGVTDSAAIRTIQTIQGSIATS